jgi:3,4-dihydroxyphthalate decarboxylase
MVDKNELRETVAASCRLLAFLGLVRETTGHVSARIDENRMLIRCRGNQESGLIYTESEMVREVDFDGRNLDGDDYETPTEFPIHGEIYKARPEINAVVHAHPHASTVCSLVGAELKPIFGAYDGHAMQLATKGIPVFPRSVLIREPATAHAMIEVMGDKSVCVLKGHGIVAAADTVEQATLHAIKLDTLAGMTLEILRAGGTPAPVSNEDLEYWDQLRASRDPRETQHNKDVWKWTWRHYMTLMSKDSSLLSSPGSSL